MDSQTQEDINHIISLLAVLPIPDENDEDSQRRVVDFWRDFDRSDGRYEGKPDPDYILTKMRAVISVWSRPTSNNHSWVGQYCLMFFDGNRPELWAMIGNRLGVAPPREADAIALGRRWAEDLCATAWRLYMRETRNFPQNEDLIERWSAVEIAGLPLHD